MDADLQAQRLYDGIALVPRLGDRRRGELCVMSLVALLAGERHSDHPATACPVIAAFAIKLNDALDCDQRQRLKPFAPRVLATNDGHGGERAWLLSRAAVNDVLPVVAAARGDRAALRTRLPRRRPENAGLAEMSARVIGEARAAGLTRTAIADLRYLMRACLRDCDELVASAAAVLIIDAAREMPDSRRSDSLLDTAIDLLDRMCDVGVPSRAPQRLIEAQVVADATRRRHARAYAPLITRLKRRLAGRSTSARGPTRARFRLKPGADGPNSNR